MSEFQEIKHLYSYGIQTCLTGMHFHQDLCGFVDSGFKALCIFYGDSQWDIHGTFIFEQNNIGRSICLKDPLPEVCQPSSVQHGLPRQHSPASRSPALTVMLT